ncbi:MAG: AAA family ATPase [Pleurocapsa minor GSE-CHR-MK-17-07R]|jgi:class 3 adenylate cyclase|nr:AAA family ATPase [Pleurocapsa minor GSE-CHR-MK 17-07R]
MNWQTASSQDALIAAVTTAIESLRLERRKRYQKHPHPTGKRFSQEELTDYAYPSYKNLLLGRTRRLPDRDTLMSIAHYLECSLEESNHLLHAARYALETPMIRERKLLTIAFIDLSYSPALHQMRDVEDLADLLMTLRNRFERVIAEAGGRVVNHVATTLVAAWGTRKTREDDPESAVRTVWLLKSLLKSFSDEHDALFDLRAGIHTGMALLESAGANDTLHLTGESVNIASRLQEAVAAGVLVSPSTYRHIRMQVQAAPFTSATGDLPSVQGYLLTDLKPASTRSRPASQQPESPLVAGRGAELALMQHALNEVIVESTPAMLLVEGEAGIGKSRLVAEFLEWTRWMPEAVTYYTARASAYGTHMTNSMFCEMFVYRFRLMDQDSEATMLRKFERGFIDAIGNTQEAYTEAHLLCYFLGYSSDEAIAGPYARDPTRLHERVLQSLEVYFRGIALQTPVLMLLEDLHWSDHSSVQMLRRLMGRLMDVPILAVISTRPSPQHAADWSGMSGNVQRIRLMALDPQDSHALIAGLFPPGTSIEPELEQFVVQRAEGNPLFIQELMHMLGEQQAIQHRAGGWHLNISKAPEQIPTTLMSILQARMADLQAGELVVLQVASVVGRIFWDSSIEAILSDLPDHHDGEINVASALEGLRQRMLIVLPKESVYRDQREYVFFHAMMRDAAYLTILKRDRRLYHQGAARWLADALRRGVYSQEYSSILAGHYEAAEMTAEAIHWYGQAVRYAQMRNAHTVARELLEHMLALALRQEQPQSLIHDLEMQLAACLKLLAHAG